MVEEVEENMCEEAKGNHNPTPTLVRGTPDAFKAELYLGEHTFSLRA